MIGWYIALFLYALPVLEGFRYLNEGTEDVLDWMRENRSYWFPSYAPAVAVCTLILWPLAMIAEILRPTSED